MRLFLLIIMLGSPVVATAADDAFEQHVAPLLITRCLECHKGGEPSGGLSLESAAGLKAGGESGAAIEPRNAAGSHLFERVANGEMPPPVKGVPQKLSAAEQNILRNWIDGGADWPQDRTLDLYEFTTAVRGGRDWWAFQPIVRPKIPGDSSKNPIDAFIGSKLAESNRVPAPPADARTLVRRLFHDVVGLPPAAEQIGEWTRLLNADRSSAVVRLVDHLLASPHHGERWARYWLDVVRYAETSGYERDQPKTFAWKYRDWVVNAFNSDLPFDRFVVHQLAGDEVENRNAQTAIATGFLRLGTWNDEPNDDQDYRYERLEDMVHTTSSAFLGLTVKCARCHDHKFDPIPQHDYYRIASAFWPGPIAARDRKLLGGPSVDEFGFKDVLGWTDLSATPKPLHVLKDGERHKPREEAQPGPLTLIPTLFAPFTAPPKTANTTGRRLQLAKWIADKRNPLTARVWVNRLWLHHFGEGLVRSPNNFGYKGDVPVHGELLDFLADEFIRSGWSTKHIHRLILTSTTWQQSVVHPQQADYARHDSANQLWWHANRSRLDAESLRDCLLSVSGEIDLRLGGEGFKPTISAEALEGFSRKQSVWQAAPDDQQRRRSLYIFVSRSLMPPMMATFDQCDTTLSCGRRDVTTVPTQALAMLNNHFVHARSMALARRAIGESKTEAEQLRNVWRMALGRGPTDEELKLAESHVAVQLQRFENPAPPNPIEFPATDALSVESGLVLHLASDAGVETNKSGQVVRWADQTAGHHASQTQATARPQLIAGSGNQKPAIRFNGKGQFLKVDGELLSSGQCSIFAVVTDNATTDHREIISNWNGGKGNAGTSVFLGLTGSGTVRFTDSHSAGQQLSDTRKPFLLTAINGPRASVWQNTSSISVFSGPLPNRQLGFEWVIGTQGNINGEFWNGDISEIVVYDRPLSDEERTRVWGYLLHKYDLPTSAPPIKLDAHVLAIASLCHVLLNSNEFLYVD